MTPTPSGDTDTWSGDTDTRSGDTDTKSGDTDTSVQGHVICSMKNSNFSLKLPKGGLGS